MKFILLAAALAATPALAQTTTPTDNGAMNGQTAPQGQTMQGQTAPQGQGAPGQSMQPGGTPMGGYQPSGSAMNGQATPGAPVTYQQAQSPDQAFPAPAPLDHYPPCKPGQYDQCMQTAGSHRMMKGHKAKAHKPMAHKAMPMRKKAAPAAAPAPAAQ